MFSQNFSHAEKPFLICKIKPLVDLSDVVIDSYGLQPVRLLFPDKNS